MAIGVAQLVEESVGPSLDVRSRRMNKRPLLRLVHPQNRRAGQGTGKSKMRTNAPHRDAASAQLAAPPGEHPVIHPMTLRRRGTVHLLGPLWRVVGSC
jgi:hypothetical protein